MIRWYFVFQKAYGTLQRIALQVLGIPGNLLTMDVDLCSLIGYLRWGSATSDHSPSIWMLISSWRAASGRLPQRQQAKVLAIVALLHCFFEDLCTSKPIGGTSDQRRVMDGE